VLALVVVLRLVDAAPAARRWAAALLVVTLLQGAIGYAQYLTGLPAALVALHMLGASLLTLAVSAVVVTVTGTPWHALVGRLSDTRAVSAAGSRAGLEAPP
jgi:heme a synthase